MRRQRLVEALFAVLQQQAKAVSGVAAAVSACEQLQQSPYVQDGTFTIKAFDAMQNDVFVASMALSGKQASIARIMINVALMCQFALSTSSRAVHVLRRGIKSEFKKLLSADKHDSLSSYRMNGEVLVDKIMALSLIVVGHVAMRKQFDEVVSAAELAAVQCLRNSLMLLRKVKRSTVQTKKIDAALSLIDGFIAEYESAIPRYDAGSDRIEDALADRAVSKSSASVITESSTPMSLDDDDDDAEVLTSGRPIAMAAAVTSSARFDMLRTAESGENAKGALLQRLREYQTKRSAKKSTFIKSSDSHSDWANSNMAGRMFGCGYPKQVKLDACQLLIDIIQDKETGEEPAFMERKTLNLHVGALLQAKGALRATLEGCSLGKIVIDVLIGYQQSASEHQSISALITAIRLRVGAKADKREKDVLTTPKPR